MGAGNLDVFSFSPKIIFQLPAGPTGPSGNGIRVVAQDYAIALAPDPDGSVVVALHGAGLQRIVAGQVQSVFNFLTMAVSGYGLQASAVPLALKGWPLLPTGLSTRTPVRATATQPGLP